MISPLALLPFLRYSCSYLFCPSSYCVFSYSSSSFGGFGLLHSHACSCLCSLWVHCTSALPSSGVSVGWGVVCVGFCTGIASGSSWCFFSFCCLASSVCACSCSSPASSLLPSTSWAWPVSSAPGLGSPPLVSVAPCLHAVTLPGAPMFFSCLCSSFLLCSSWLRCGSLCLPLRCLGLLRLLVYLQ